MVDVTSVVILSLANPTLGQYFGRRKTLAIGQVYIIAGALIQCTSYGLAQMIVGRIVTGFGMGHITATAPVWAVSSLGGRKTLKIADEHNRLKSLDHHTEAAAVLLFSFVQCLE